MSLDVVNERSFENKFFNQSTIANEIFSKWRTFPVSRISSHDQSCCQIALHWLHAMDFSQLNGESVFNGPRWIPARFSWGPTKWPIHWCEALQQKYLDCGAQSAIAFEIFRMREVECYRVQLVQQFSTDATRQWREKWLADDTTDFWIDENLIYHECCAIVTREGELKIWDGSAACWVSPRQQNGYGSVRALRIDAQSSSPISFVWGDHTIRANTWHSLL